MGFRRLIFYSALVVLAGFLQHWPYFSINGIRPNFVLVFLVVISFLCNDFAEYLWLVFLAMLILQFQTGFDGGLFGTGLIATAAFWLGREMPWLWIFNNAILAVIGTLAAYILAGPYFISANLLVVGGEILYNVIIGTLLFLTFSADERRFKF